MDEERITLWLKDVWDRWEKSGKSHSLFVWDMFGNLKLKKKKHLQQFETDIAVIPGRLTLVIQQLDISLNKPFKDVLREQ